MVGRRTALPVLLLLFATAAYAQVAFKAPVSSTAPTNFPPGHKFYWCAKADLEWEVLFENPTAAPIVISYDDDVRTGLNSGAVDIFCPPTYLPPGVNPALDVTCVSTPAQQTLQVRNIAIPACGRVRLRFATTGGPGLDDFCNGGTVTAGLATFRTKTPYTDQIPTQSGDTCVFVSPLCGMAIDARGFTTVENEDGAQMLPGDSLHMHSWIDFTRFGFSTTLDVFEANADTIAVPGALPPEIDFVDWIARPLPAPASYEWLPAARTLQVWDPTGTAPPDVNFPMGAVTEVVDWRGRLRCDAPAGVPVCLTGAFHMMAMGSAITKNSDDPRSYLTTPDATCFVPVPPDLGQSTKLVADANRSGDAQPGEILTFSINALDATPCPADRMTCECGASAVEIVDTVDTTRLDMIQPLDGGVLMAPDKVRWLLPKLVAGVAQQVRIQARVKTTLNTGDRICNQATITAAELKNIADGGRSHCATKAPTNIGPTCIDVVVPPAPALLVIKSAPQSGYCPGDTITYSVEVRNGGGAPANQVQVWDVLDFRWAPIPTNITPLNGGMLCTPSTTPSCNPSQVQWPVLPTLAPGATQIFQFRALVPPYLPGTVIPNTAKANTQADPTNVAQSSFPITVVAPSLVFEKALPALPAGYSEGDPITWTITLKNAGSCAATGVVVSDLIDTAVLDDTVPTSLTWTPPDGVYTSATRTLAWPVIASLAVNDTRTFTVTAFIKKPGTAGLSACNTATVIFDQGGPLDSTPLPATCPVVQAANSCTAITTEVQRVLVTKTGATRVDLRLEWDLLALARDGYDVWRVTDKRQIVNAKLGGGPPAPTPVCVPTAVLSCVDVNAIPLAAGSPLFYQTKGICGVLEGP